MENRLVRATGATVAELAYDPLGRLWQTSSGGQAYRRFVYDVDAMVAEYSGMGTLVRRYVHGSAVDEPLIWYEGAAVSAATRRQLSADHQGSIVAVANATGTLIAANAYDEYGIPAATNYGRFQYTGQVWIPELGMYHYKARIYSPTLGRFLQTDPIGYDDQINLYAYVGNDPVNVRDPSGERRVFGWIVERVNGGLRKVQTLHDRREAIRAVRQGRDVQTTRRQDSVAVSRASHPNRRATERDSGHPLRDGSGQRGLPHAHPGRESGSHVFWEAGSAIIAGAVVVGEVVQTVADMIDQATNIFDESGLSPCQTLGACRADGTVIEDIQERQQRLKEIQKDLWRESDN